jgi:hypothetical protein
VSRPSDSTSIVAIIFAVKTGGRCGTTVTEVTSRSFSVLAATKATQVKHAVDCGSGSDLLTYANPVCRGVVTSEIKRFDQDVLTPLFRLDIQGLPLSAHLAFGETIPLFDVEDFGLGPNWLGILREKLYVRRLYPESWPGEVLLEGRSPKILILDENGLGPIDSRRGGITRAVVGLGKPVELFRRLNGDFPGRAVAGRSGILLLGSGAPDAEAHGTRGSDRHVRCVDKRDARRLVCEEENPEGGNRGFQARRSASGITIVHP